MLNFFLFFISQTFCHFPHIKDKISLHLVEVSPTLGQIQEAKLTGQDVGDIVEDSDCVGAYRTATSKYGIDVSWYRNLVDVPQGLSCFIAHEFLDALPIYKFQVFYNVQTLFSFIYI